MKTYTQAELEEILKNHKLWLKSKSSKGKQANLSRIFLRRINFLKTNLQKINFSGADLLGANLEGVNLEGANLERAYLFEANLRGANLSGANLWEANFTRANLKKVNFKETNLLKVNLNEANLINATGLVIPKPGKAYKLKKGYSFYVKSLDEWQNFEENETGLILGIHGSQNENHLVGKRGGFDLLFLNGNKKGEIWRGIDWPVLLTNIEKEAEL